MTEIPDELIELLQPGTAVRILSSSGKTREIHHIRAIVDGDQIVFRTWSERKQYWRYFVENTHYYYLTWQDGRLKRA